MNKRPFPPSTRRLGARILRIPRGPAVATALLQFAAWHGMALAQTEVSAVLEQVTVTTDETSDDPSIPDSRTTLDRTKILHRGAQNVGDALRGEAGIAVASDSAQGQNPVLRGLQKESVVLLVDGMRLNAEQPFGSVSAFMSLGLAERVEVVKGPASVLYGSGALGGAINVRLRQARFVPGTRFEASAMYDSASDGVRGTGIANYSAGDHALMIGASLARIGDYDASRGRVADTGYDSDAWIGQYRFRIDGAQQIRVSVQRQTDEDVWYPGTRDLHSFSASLLPFFPGRQASDLTLVFRSPFQRRELVEIGYSLKIDGAMPGNFDVRVYRQDMERTVNAWADWLGQDIVRTSVVFATEGLEAKADWLVHPQHLLTLGVSAWRMDASPTRYLRPMPTFVGESRNDPFEDARVEALGAYLLDNMLFGRLTVVAGLRYDTVKGGAASMTNGLNAPVVTGLERKDGNLSGSLGASYEVAPLLRPYASLSRAFRAPSLIERFVTGPRGDGYWYAGDPQAKPEIATQFELGIKGENASLEYGAALYRTRITDYLTGRLLPFILFTDPDGSGNVVCGGPFGRMCKKTVNLGEVVIDGIEASARWQYRRDHWLTLKYSRIRGENKDQNEPLYRMPADELSLTWEGPAPFPDPRWTADATLRLVARQDRVATAFTSGTEDQTPGFGTLDLGATWNYAKSRSLRIALKNLADKAYHEHLAVGVPGREIDAPGRNLQLIWQGQF